jgi:PDZ domain-containing secreted protein
MDIFTVYLADLNYKKILVKQKYVKYPIGDVIVEINDMKFNNYEEFINIVKNHEISKIKTIDNEVYYL